MSLVLRTRQIYSLEITRLNRFFVFTMEWLPLRKQSTVNVRLVDSRQQLDDISLSRHNYLLP